MDENQNTNIKNNRQSVIGTGRKTALYGCGFMILAVIVIFMILVLTGAYNPFSGTEGVGP